MGAHHGLSGGIEDLGGGHGVFRCHGHGEFAFATTGCGGARDSVRVGDRVAQVEDPTVSGPLGGAEGELSCRAA